MDLLILYLVVFLGLGIGIVMWSKAKQLEDIDELITDMENLNRISKQYKWNEKMSKEDREFLEEFVKK